MKLENLNIAIISPERWGVVKVSKHHYSLELAKRENRVYFINPPSTDHQDVSVQCINNNITVIDYPKVAGINKLPKLFRDRIHKRQIRKFYKIWKIPKLDIIWSFDPFVFQNLNLFNARRKIYHVVDYHNANLEINIANSADMVLTVSDLLLEKFLHIDKPQFHVNHGLSNQFITEDNFHSSLALNSRDNISVGILGNLQMRLIKLELIKEIVDNNSSIDFHFIGPNGRSNIGDKQIFEYSDLLTKENTFFHGPIEHDEVAKTITNFDMFLICYDTSDKMLVSNTHKVLEFLSTGKVVVSTYTDQYKNKKNLIEMTDWDRDQDIIHLFHRVANNLNAFNSPDLISARKKYAAENSYSNQVDKIEEHLTQLETN